MSVIGLTGGPATGKSTFSKLLLRELPVAMFDCDRCVHDMLASDESVRHEIEAAFGPGALDETGKPDRNRLRDIVFADDTRRGELEAILHPRVRSAWTAAASAARASGGGLLVDMPLLFETGAAGEFDRIIVVAATEKTQLQRLTTNRRLAPALAARIIRAQMELGAKTRQADHVIWNDSTVSNLDGQTRLLASWLRRRFA